MSKHCLFFDDWKFQTNSANLFGAVRKYDVHTGIDIFMHEDAPVYLPFDGEVVKIGNFTGTNAEPFPSPWWNDTQYVIIKHMIPAFYWYGDLILKYVLYGEIEVSREIKIGDKLPEGTIIGNILEVLRNDKGSPTSMLHVEMYNEIPEYPVVLDHSESIPTCLEDPYDFLCLCNMKRTPNYVDIMNDICMQYNISSERNFDNGCLPRNQGSCYGTVKTSGHIMLSPFDDPLLEFVAFFHELGHLLTVCNRGYSFTKMSYEGMAWEIGFDEAYKHGFMWLCNNNVITYANTCYASYWTSESNKPLRDCL